MGCCSAKTSAGQCKNSDWDAAQWDAAAGEASKPSDAPANSTTQQNADKATGASLDSAKDDPDRQVSSFTRRPTFEGNLLRTLFKPVPLDGSWDQESWLEEFIAVDLENPALRAWAGTWPDLAWFDPDEAMQVRPDWFKGKEKRKVLETISAAIRAVHRWNFVRCMVTMGEDWMTTALVMQMKILSHLLSCRDIQQPGLRILDAGCGTGSLCALLAVLTHESAEIVGIDVHLGAIDEGKKIMLEPDTFPGLSKMRRSEALRKISLEVGDLVRMLHGPNVDDLHSFPDDHFDIVNVGTALSSSQSSRIVQCSREGAVLCMPLLKPESVPDDADRHVASFGVYRKTDSQLQGPIEEFSVNFIKAARFSKIFPAAAEEHDLYS